MFERFLWLYKRPVLKCLHWLQWMVFVNPWLNGMPNKRMRHCGPSLCQFGPHTSCQPQTSADLQRRRIATDWEWTLSFGWGPLLRFRRPWQCTKRFSKGHCLFTNNCHWEIGQVLPEDFEAYEKDKHAAIALCELFRQHSDVTLVCIGPLTNVALALKLCPEFAKLPSRLVMLGGNVFGKSHTLWEQWPMMQWLLRKGQCAQLLDSRIQLFQRPWSSAHCANGNAMPNYSGALGSIREGVRGGGNRVFRNVRNALVGHWFPCSFKFGLSIGQIFRHCSQYWPCQVGVEQAPIRLLRWNCRGGGHWPGGNHQNRENASRIRGIAWPTDKVLFLLMCLTFFLTFPEAKWQSIGLAKFGKMTAATQTYAKSEHQSNSCWITMCTSWTKW